MFAAAPIAAGEIVAVAGGVVMTEEEFQAYRATVTRWNATQIGEALHLVDLIQAPDASSGSINHSCDSNLWLKDEVTLVARRDIVAGEELTLDYALTTIESSWTLDQPCHCGSSLCRQAVTGNDWLLPDVRERYASHFAPFINDYIRASEP
jgi:SET domain-containing protein